MYYTYPCTPDHGPVDKGPGVAFRTKGGEPHPGDNGVHRGGDPHDGPPDEPEHPSRDPGHMGTRDHTPEPQCGHCVPGEPGPHRRGEQGTHLRPRGVPNPPEGNPRGPEAVNAPRRSGDCFRAPGRDCNPNLGTWPDWRGCVDSPAGSCPPTYP